MENSGFERKLEAFFIVRARLLDFHPVLEVVHYFSVCGGILVCTSDLRSDAVRIESSNLSRPIKLYALVAELVDAPV